MRALYLTTFGSPSDSLRFMEIPEPPAPGANQAVINLESSPINPNDLMVALGMYAHRPTLPTVSGNEGKAQSGVAALPTTRPLTIRRMPLEEAARDSFVHSA